MAIVFHADDYGITPCQAREIISLTRPFDGALSSVSVFANSPAFETSAALARPLVDDGSLTMALHANLVEGRPCSDPESIPLLTNERGTFANDFGKLLLMSTGRARSSLREQMVRELSAQMKRYLEAFPEQTASLNVDTHQHTHAIPLVLDALLEAADKHSCSLNRLRIPIEPVIPHMVARSKGLLSANMAKNAIIASLMLGARKKLPQKCLTPSFCGVLLSGRMESLSDEAIKALEKKAAASGRDIEVLFHPVAVPLAECLDPQNRPFAKACASPGRDAEAARLIELKRAFPN